MKILDFYGIEMEKEMKTSFQDYFNESFVDYEEHGKRKTFSVVYLRYFEEKMAEMTPFGENPVCILGDRTYDLKDVLALIILLSDSRYKGRKRLYISDENKFKAHLTGMNREKVQQLLAII